MYKQNKHSTVLYTIVKATDSSRLIAKVQMLRKYYSVEGKVNMQIK